MPFIVIVIQLCATGWCASADKGGNSPKGQQQRCPGSIPSAPCILQVSLALQPYCAVNGDTDDYCATFQSRRCRAGL